MNTPPGSGPGHATARRGLIWLTAITCVLSVWTWFVIREMARTWATNLVWWAALPALAAGPLSLVTFALALRRPRVTPLLAINGVLLAAHVALWAMLVMPG